MISNWAYYYIRKDFIPLIDAFADCLKKRVLPSFENLSSEADEVENEAWNQLSSFAPEDSDPSDFVESAFNAGLEFYQTMTELAQGMRNLFAVGLYHLFEQQFLRFHRGELLDFGEQDDPNLFKTSEAVKRLAGHGIHIDEFGSWAKVKELKTLANAVKHADGGACDELKRVRPDLFSHPEGRELGPYSLDGLRVFQPLEAKTYT